MKHLKTFKIFEGEGRMEFDEDGRHAICGPSALPQTWDWRKEQSKDFDPKSLIMDPSYCYNYLWDSDDHIDANKVDKMIKRHKKRDNKFGFDPSKEDLES